MVIDNPLNHRRKSARDNHLKESDIPDGRRKAKAEDFNLEAGSCLDNNPHANLSARLAIFI